MDELILYVAYQCDVSTFQASMISKHPETSEEKESYIQETAKALLVGWWATAQNLELAKGLGCESQRFLALPHAFVVRMTRQGWSAYEVEFTSEDMLEAVVSPVDNGVGLVDVPSAWPDFVHGE